MVGKCRLLDSMVREFEELLKFTLSTLSCESVENNPPSPPLECVWENPEKLLMMANLKFKIYRFHSTRKICISLTLLLDYRYAGQNRERSIWTHYLSALFDQPHFDIRSTHERFASDVIYIHNNLHPAWIECKSHRLVGVGIYCVLLAFPKVAVVV